MSGSAGGLGRGLAAILTGPSLAGPDTSLRGKFIDTALSSLSAVTPLSLCGSIHESSGEVDVTLRSPELRSLHPTQAYALFTALGGVVDLDPGRHPFEVDELPAMGVSASTAHARNLLFFGDAGLDSILTDQLASFCEVYAPVLLGHDAPASENERVHLVLDQEGGAVHAEVTVNDQVGFGSAPRSHQAAALAAVSAICNSAKLINVNEVRAADGAAAVAVIAGERQRTAMGAAPVVAGPDAAAALAALRAAKNLAD